ncbi:MAG: ribonuclease III [Clostridia bacterium]|nr:ribonuclease III [Clostridia bacterium]
MQLDFDKIESILQYKFKNKSIAYQAFVHSSFANAEGIEDNERMEFFGDSVLELLSSEYLYDKYPDCDAGQLSKMRAKIVSADGLRPVMEKMDILKYLQVSEGASKIRKLSKKIEANLYEAILCAIYLDGGLEAARQFVLRTLSESMDQAINLIKKDYKTILQEFCQQKKWSVNYQFVDKTGPDNNPLFKYALYIDGKYVSEGQGSTIKQAEQNAAKTIVEDWRIY